MRQRGVNGGGGRSAMGRLAGACVACAVAGTAMSAWGFADEPAAKRAEGTRDVSLYNLPKSHLAIEGYDPVSYFPEGGGKPMKGLELFQAEHGGVTYRFASKENMAAFQADPAKYEPAYGGWCAYAMAKGKKVEVDPKSFTLTGGRLNLFYKGLFSDTRSDWLKDDAALKKNADESWKKISGEDLSKPQASKMDKLGILGERLKAKRDESAGRMPEEVKKVFAQGIQDVATSGVMETALKVGAKAPDFELPGAKGEKVKLSTLLEKGPVVLAWYRGTWCPYCNIQLRAYQESLDQIKALGADLVAISPQTPDQSLSITEKNELKFHVLSDAGNKIAEAFGLRYTLPSAVQEKFKGFGLDLSTFNGDSSNQLPLSATYVIAKDGTIAYAFLDADYTRRAEVEDLVGVLTKLKAGAK